MKESWSLSRRTTDFQEGRDVNAERLINEILRRSRGNRGGHRRRRVFIEGDDDWYEIDKVFVGHHQRLLEDVIVIGKGKKA